MKKKEITNFPTKKSSIIVEKKEIISVANSHYYSQNEKTLIVYIKYSWVISKLADWL